ncbi:MAG: response regulator, partial [Polyangia bacterium]|nr:response regulator [Polyangia bacterium]
AAEPRAEREPELEPSSGGRILLVDDEPLILNATTAMLKRLGYDVVACQDSNEAVAIYAERWASIDLVLLDMVMPDLSGKATFAALQSINPKVRAVLASGYSLNGEAQEILDDGVMGFIQKPFRMAELAKVVSQALQGS